MAVCHCVALAQRRLCSQEPSPRLPHGNPPTTQTLDPGSLFHILNRKRETSLLFDRIESGASNVKDRAVEMTLVCRLLMEDGRERSLLWEA